jgi:hypothetical protein
MRNTRIKGSLTVAFSFLVIGARRLIARVLCNIKP